MYPDKLIEQIYGVKIYQCVAGSTMYYKVTDINEQGNEYIIIITGNLELARTYSRPKINTAR